jgi:Kef-type K+ transport system membrane component KefB
VALGLSFLGFAPEVALILAGISTATAPAATADVVEELDAEGPFTRTLLGVIAIDDAWGLVVFSLAVSAVGILVGVDGSDAIAHGLREVFGALALGLAIGLPAAALTGRIQPGEPTQAEALGIVFLCGGLAMWLQVSFLLAAMMLGATVANLARHHQRPFHAIRGIEWPVMILFFVLAGASFEPALIGRIWPLVLAYVSLRALGSVLGTWAGAQLASAEEPIRRWLGLALLPQAGVALGMALVASQRFPELGFAIVNSVVASTAVLELLGPVLTRFALQRAGEAQGRGGIA